MQGDEARLDESRLAKLGLDEANQSDANQSDANLSDNDEVTSGELDLASAPFEGQWNGLISTTNWEKGQIIAEWREALIAAQAPASEYCDEAWSRRVGGVTPQHVGRLRRVYQKFAHSREKFAGLYWSHFYAALDWDDAPMWLEGATQSDWSVSQMRRQRWETLDGLDKNKPREEDIVSSDLDEDFTAESRGDETPDIIDQRVTELASGPRHEGPDFGDDSDASAGGAAALAESDDESHEEASGDETAVAGPPAEVVRPFENLPRLPDDLADTLDAFKLAILRHKTDGWRDVACPDVIAYLEALKTMILQK